jgi:hypothetical protein
VLRIDPCLPEGLDGFQVPIAGIEVAPFDDGKRGALVVATITFARLGSARAC